MKLVLVSTHHWPLPAPVHTGDVLVLDLARALRELGHDVTLCSPTGTDFPNLFPVEAAEGRGVPTAAEAEASLLARASDLFASADVIHDFSVTKSICRAWQSKALCTPFSSSDGNNLSTLRNIVCQSWAQRERSLRGATDYEGTEWPLLAGPPQAPIRDARVVHNGIDTEWYAPTCPQCDGTGKVLDESYDDAGHHIPDECDLCGGTGHEYQETKDDFYLWLGRWALSRGYQLAIDLARQNPEFQFVMSGERPEDARFEPERNSAREAVEMARGVKNVHFEWLPVEGHHEAKRELYRRARAFLMLPRFAEPFGLQQVEAMACGTPVVGARIGSVPEVIEHGVTGIVADVPVLSRALRAVTDISPEKCRSEAVRRFDRRVMAREYVKLYEEIVAGGSW